MGEHAALDAARHLQFRTDPEDWFFQTTYLKVTLELRQRIYDDYQEAWQALCRAEMANDPDDYREASSRLGHMMHAWIEVETDGELIVKMCGEEKYTEYWKEA